MIVVPNDRILIVSKEGILGRTAYIISNGAVPNRAVAFGDGMMSELYDFLVDAVDDGKMIVFVRCSMREIRKASEMELVESVASATIDVINELDDVADEEEPCKPNHKCHCGHCHRHVPS